MASGFRVSGANWGARDGSSIPLRGDEMKRVRFNLGGALIAVVAICAAAPSAKADLLSIDGVLVSGSSGTFSDANFSGTYKVTDTYVGGTETLAVTITATSLKSSGAPLTYDLIGQAAGYAVPPGSNTLTSTFAIANSTKATGGSGANTADYFGTNNLDSEIRSSGSATPGGPTGSGSSSNSVGLFHATNFTLETKGGFIGGITKNGTITFTATSQVHGVPEPSAVISALAGLPCVGLLLGFARRLRRPVETAVTA
jgi:hypothetical protein